MSKEKTTGIVIVIVVAALAAALLVFASQTNRLLSGDYYVRVDNARISTNDATGGVINLRSSEPYVYELDAVNEEGDEATIEFGVSRELRQDALLKISLQPIRGVVSWSEVTEDDLPSKVAETLDK